MPYQAKLCITVSCSNFVWGSLVILNNSFSVEGHLKLICLSVSYLDRSPRRGRRRRLYKVTDFNELPELALRILAWRNLLVFSVFSFRLILLASPFSSSKLCSFTIPGVEKVGVNTFSPSNWMIGLPPLTFSNSEKRCLWIFAGNYAAASPLDF